MLQKYDCVALKHVYDIVTGDESRIYENEAQNKQQSTVWVFTDEPNPIKVAFARSTSKQMIACLFFRKNWTTRTTQNSHFWVVYNHLFASCLSRRKSSRWWWITLHHDNASSHASAQTTAFLSARNIDLIIHPPYSPDLAPNSFFLFLYGKNKMRGQSERPQSDWKKCFDNWFKRIPKCIDL